MVLGRAVYIPMGADTPVMALGKLAWSHIVLRYEALVW